MRVLASIDLGSGAETTSALSLSIEGSVDFVNLISTRFDDFAATDNVEDVYAVGGEEVTVRVGEPVPPGAVFVRRQSIPERSGELRFGDGDTFADPGELINLDLMLENLNDAELTGVQVRVSTDSPAVGCVTDPVAFYGTLGAGAARFNRLEDRFQFVVDTNEAANSLDLGGGLQQVTFSVSVSADAFGGTQLLQRLILVLDLDVLAGAGQTARTFFEGFEDQDVDGNGTIDPGETLSDQLGRDAFVRWEGQGRGEVFLVDGPVCPSDQPLNPDVTVNEDFISFEEEDWHIHTQMEPDRSGTGKSHGGANSLHYGRHVPQNDGTIGDGYRLNRQIAVRLQDVNLDLTGASELDFWHIVELMGWEYPGFDYFDFQGEDRGLVEVRADSNPDPVVTEFGAWERVEPYLGMYEATQDQKYLTTASFDPGDDANPANPVDPSNTMCFPLLTWIQQGSSRGTDAVGCTDQDVDGTNDCGFSEGRTNPNRRGPGFTERGETGVGVWVHTKFNLARYAGRRIQARFIVSTIDDAEGFFVSYLETDTFVEPIDVDLQSDDGWYVDDVRITETVAEEIHLAIDTTAGRDGSPEGIATCPPPRFATLFIGAANGRRGNTVDIPVDLATSGDARPAILRFDVAFDPLKLGLDPGAVVCGASCRAAGKTVQASEIEEGRVRVSVSGENDTVIPDGELIILPVSIATDASVGVFPLECQQAMVFDFGGNTFEIRCTGGSVTVLSLLQIGSTSLSWDEVPDAVGYDLVRGDLLGLHRSEGDFTSSVLQCIVNNYRKISRRYTVDPSPGEGFWFLMRAVHVDRNGTYDSGGTAQVGLRDAEIDASPSSCP